MLVTNELKDLRASKRKPKVMFAKRIWFSIDLPSGIFKFHLYTTINK